jgi:hypothetical protein
MLVMVGISDGVVFNKYYLKFNGPVLISFIHSHIDDSTAVWNLASSSVS